jgi:Rab GDP dissociation inhibitor
MAVCKVPTNPKEALASQLMGLIEKKRVITLYKFIANVREEDSNTWGGIDMKNAPFEEVYKKFGILDTTKDFLGHAVALHFNDNYLYMPALDTIMKMQLYLDS